MWILVIRFRAGRQRPVVGLVHLFIAVDCPQRIVQEAMHHLACDYRLDLRPLFEPRNESEGEGLVFNSGPSVVPPL